MTVANTKISSSTAMTTTTKIETKPEINEKRLRDTDNTVLWTIVALKDCEWTKKTTDLLTSKKEQFKLVYINAEWQRRLVVEFNCRRSPAIFKGPTYFGSYDALENYYKCSFFSDHEII
jgi:glutaredoxin